MIIKDLEVGDIVWIVNPKCFCFSDNTLFKKGERGTVVEISENKCYVKKQGNTPGGISNPWGFPKDTEYLTRTPPEGQL
jgi:hypothetical protein